MITIVFTACSKTNNQANEDNQGVTKEPTQVESQTSDEITRIVSFSPSITEIIYALGAGDLLVGRTSYCDYPSEVLNVENIGDFYTPDMEKIIELDPDVVIATSLWTEDIAEKFEEAGIQVIVLNEASKVEDVETIISSLGQALNRQENATKLIENMKSDLEQLTKKVSSLEPKSVYYVVEYGEYGDYTSTGETYIHEMLTLAGGDNIAKDATGWTYSLETLLEQDPEVIIIGEKMLEDFLSYDQYKNLSAVKNNHVYGIDNNLLDRQSNRTVEGIRAIAKILHPEAFTE